MANIGYARVSTADQDPALQFDALAKADCERLKAKPELINPAYRPPSPCDLTKIKVGAQLRVYTAKDLSHPDNFPTTQGDVGVDPRNSSRPAASSCDNRPDTWMHPSRPVSADFPLAPEGPSTHRFFDPPGTGGFCNGTIRHLSPFDRNMPRIGRGHRLQWLRKVRHFVLAALESSRHPVRS